MRSYAYLKPAYNSTHMLISLFLEGLKNVERFDTLSMGIS